MATKTLDHVLQEIDAKTCLLHAEAITLLAIYLNHDDDLSRLRTQFKLCRNRAFQIANLTRTGVAKAEKIGGR
jgi:hypothetical protein